MVESTTVMVAHSPDLVQFRNVAVAHTVRVKKKACGFLTFFTNGLRIFN